MNLQVEDQYEEEIIKNDQEYSEMSEALREYESDLLSQEWCP